MDIKVYLKEGTKMEELSGFEKKNKARVPLEEEVCYVGMGLTLYQKSGRWYFSLDNLGDYIPSIFKDSVDEILVEYEFDDPSRGHEDGFYTHKDAVLECKKDRWDNTLLKMRSKNMSDVLELYRMFRAFKIKPKEKW